MKNDSPKINTIKKRDFQKVFLKFENQKIFFFQSQKTF
jgi:hypothetical protein